jgi:hypothetical protein
MRNYLLMNAGKALLVVSFFAASVPLEANDEVRTALKNYKLIYDLDLANLGRPVRYDVDESRGFVGEFDRIAYWLELQKPGEEIKFVCVSMDAFTTDIGKIGVPTTGTEAAFQTKVTQLDVLSNVEGVKQGQGLQGGNIEFWPNKYAPSNSGNISGASEESFDLGDQKGPLENGYGCMQVHNHAAGHTIFAINNWNAGAKADIGIGNSSGLHRDWTLAGNGEQYEKKRLRIFVRPTGKAGKPKESGWERSYSSGKTDENGEFLGGSEIFHIESHKGKLYAATSYWMDENNTYYSAGKRNQWAQVIVKDSKSSPWREDYDTSDDGGVLRPEILQSITFTKPDPDVNLLFLATYRTDRTKYYVDIMVRNDETGEWIKTTPHSGPKLPDAHDFSVRAMRVYTDRVTREERIFITVGIQGVLSGVYDPKVRGWIRWDPLHPVKFSERALSICEANDSLVIGAGDAVWRRKDGHSPSYSIVHDLRDLVERPVDPAIGGIRGMTTIDNPTGAGDSLLFLWSNADAKGYCGSMYRLDPDGRGGYTRHEDGRLAPVVEKEFGVHPSFILGAYSNVQAVRNPVTHKTNHLVGLYVQFNFGKHSYPTWSHKQIYMGGLFAIRDEKGRYTINEVNGRHNGSDTPLTTVRAIEPSPFPNDTDVYFGGHDCANIMSTDFAWMYKAPLRTVLRLPPSKSPALPTTKAPVPSAADQDEALATLGKRYDFAKSRTDDQKRQLVQELLGTFKGTEKPVYRFVLLRKAAELASDVGDAVLMCEIVESIHDSFQIDPPFVQGKLFQTIAAKATSSERIESLVEAAGGYIDRAVSQEKFTYAQSIASLAYHATTTAVGEPFRQEAADRLRRVKQLCTDQEKVE